jgi:hypothetical protein
MAKGKKTGGRKAGTPNKSSSEIRAMLLEEGCDPARALIQIGKRNLLTNDKLAAWCFAEVLTYVEAKRKAIEHKVQGGGDFTLEELLKTYRSVSDAG